MIRFPKILTTGLDKNCYGHLTRMVGLIAFGRPDNSLIGHKFSASKFQTIYQTFGTMTTPATETRSMGLPSDARAVKFFAASLSKFILT
jgi:hypothetical protein